MVIIIMDVNAEKKLVSNSKKEELEQYRKLTHNIGYSMNENEKTIGILSTYQNKSVEILVANLAILQSIQEKKVLVVDFNDRIRSIVQEDTVINKKYSESETKFIDTKTKWYSEDNIKNTRYNFLKVLPINEKVIENAYRLDFKNMKEILSFYEEKYEMIIVYLPPLFVNDSSRLVANEIQNLFFCITEKNVSKKDMYDVKENLEKAEIEINGFIMISEA